MAPAFNRSTQAGHNESAPGATRCTHQHPLDCCSSHALQELAKALNCGINDLPLSMDLSWFEQKAVAVLLTLLHLGVRNIRIGPRLPAFLTPAAVQLLVDNFALTPADIKNPEKDLADMMKKATA
jgi:hydroxylamine reductase (hybrid-cluster protein)